MNKIYALSLVCTFLLTACSRDNPSPDNPPRDQDTTHWTKINTGLGDISLSEIYFVDSLHGFIAASDKFLYSSTDGGLTWKKIPGIIGKTPFLSIYFLNRDQGYIVGANDLAVTTDGGVSWNVKPLSINWGGTWVFVQFLSPSTGYISTGSAIYKTTDTGTTWEKVLTGASKAMWFFNDHNGLAYTSPHTMNITSDGGEHWGTLSSIPTRYASYDLYDVLQFTDGQHGWLMDDMTLFSTTDGGSNWIITDSVNNDSDSTFFTDFQMLNNQTGYLATPIQMFKTSDGGTTWEKNYAVTGTHAISIHFLDEHYGWAGCSNGIVLKYHH